MRYDYDKAVQTQKELESEAAKANAAVNALEEELCDGNSELAFGLRMKQSILKEQKVLEMLILVAKLIHTML